jgi:uncharacterized protein YdiU (UPF0061 family)
MHHLRIPTSRAASLVVSDDTKVKRDPVYSGNVIDEKCAVVMRVAPTFMRFGSFEIFLAEDKDTRRQGPSFGLKNSMMPVMLNYVINNFYGDIEYKTLSEKHSQFF